MTRRPRIRHGLETTLVLVLSGVMSCVTGDPLSRNVGAASPQLAGPAAAAPAEAGRYAGWRDLVARTHAASLARRRQLLEQTIASDSCWPHGVWGDTMWCLAALSLNQRVGEANARLLKHAQAYLDSLATSAQGTFEPGKTGATPWAYFALGDYVRMLCLFRADSPHVPGRLEPGTEDAMKAALWRLVKSGSKVEDAALENVLVTLGTENHDLTLRPNYYLVATVLREDPAYRERLYDDGHTAAEHAEAYTAFFREWPRVRALNGLWIEVGSDTYQKYSWPALFNLADLAPDPVVRERFRMLLDLAFIEEAQISVRGRRGGGRSRAGYGGNNFELYKNILYVPDEAPAGSTHSRIIETSRYQLPDAAILLRAREFPAAAPFMISNRVLGELDPNHTPPDKGTSHAADSALVNVAYRGPGYILGSTLQDPSLAMAHPDTGEPVLRYAGISRQKRWCGMLFHDPGARPPLIPASAHRNNDEPCAIFPVIEKTRGGRPQHSFWTVQHRHVMLLQRIPPQQPEHPMRMGSYSTGNISVRFHGHALAKTERAGWIFATNGPTYAAVRFLDRDYAWDDARETATPLGYERFSCTSRILFHAGDQTADGSFEQFQETVLSNPLTVTENRVDYRFGPDGNQIECQLYDPDQHRDFVLPKINGRTVDLRPEWTYRSPYLKHRRGEETVTVTVGPVQQVYSFADTAAEKSD